ncbi:UNVERIFIED_CONTAM: hypothetical protein Sradi_1914000 [Sesamum radiatum]|uniref:Uncharacterized protein n=1 Tax=Sesamum radiatum TaxID=300843 RepID=A0AAW2U2B7_SESRA
MPVKGKGKELQGKGKGKVPRRWWGRRGEGRGSGRWGGGWVRKDDKVGRGSAAALGREMAAAAAVGGEGGKHIYNQPQLQWERVYFTTFSKGGGNMLISNITGGGIFPQ